MTGAIRAARRAELPVLQDVERAAAALFPPERLPHPEQTRSLAELERCLALGLLWVAEEDAETTGFLMAEPLDGALHVLELAVHPMFGRRGIGTALVRRSIAAAGEGGWRRVTLTTFEDLPWNAPFYQRLGFRILRGAALPEPLHALLERERAAGLTRRVAMALTLADPP